MEGLSFDLLSFEFRARVVEIKQYTTLVKLLDK